jgi:hypothetical protein
VTGQRGQHTDSAASNAHPLDEWVEITAMGEAAPIFLLAVDGREAAIRRTVEQYVHDRIPLDVLEEAIAEELGLRREEQM